MPGFRIINTLDEIKRFDWQTSTKFNSKDRIVDAEGKTVDPSIYHGRCYQLIDKKE